tara:strand:- start:867 stop:1211 length:345 start_codon:yes stop_codon:yes gene_type:complete
MKDHKQQLYLFCPRDIVELPDIDVRLLRYLGKYHLESGLDLVLLRESEDFPSSLTYCKREGIALQRIKQTRQLPTTLRSVHGKNVFHATTEGDKVISSVSQELEQMGYDLTPLD